MIKVKDGYAKLIGTTYAGSAERVLLSNGGDFGLHTGTNNQANKIVRTDANGYIYAGWINTTSGNFTGTPTKIYASNDAFIRYMTPANFFPTLTNDNNQLSITVGGQNRKLTINYATIAATVTCSEATSDTDRPIVVTNKSNGLYYTTKATLNYKTGNITAPIFIGDLKGNINPFKSISYTSGTSTVKNVKDELVTAFSNITNGIGANIIVPAYAISYWDTESTIIKNSNVYSMIKIGGGYSGTTYGLWLLSTYSSNRIGYVGRDGNAWTSISWLATTADINSLKNYYWANVKISSYSDPATKPTFATATATISVTTPLVTNTGILTLNGTSGVYLKYNNADASSLVLSSTYFKPFDSANNKLSLGTSSARWSTVYSTAGNFTGDLTLYTASGDSPALVFQRGSIGTDSIVDWRIYVTAGHLKIQNALTSHNSGNWSDVLHLDADLANKLLKSSYHVVPTTNNALTLGTSSLRWSNIYSVNGNFSGDQRLYGLTSTCNKSSDSNYMNSALQIREYNFGGALTDSWGIAPRLSWHWSGRVQTQIGLSSSGDLKLSKDNFTTSYLLLHAGNSAVSGGGSSGGSSITVNIGGTSKTLTIPTSLPANGGNADTVDSWHKSYFPIGWNGSRHYLILFGLGGLDLNWKKIAETTSNLTTAPTSNNWSASSIKGKIYRGSDNYNSGLIIEYPFMVTFHYVSGTSLMNTATLYLPRFAKSYDNIRVVRVSTNKFELQVRMTQDWRNDWIEFQGAGASLTCYESLQTANTTGTVVCTAATATTLTLDTASNAYTANGAYYVFDYNATTTPIYIGFASTGLTSTTASYLAAYGTTSSGACCIKDISAAEAKKFIGLGNVQNTAFYQRDVTVNGAAWNMAGTWNNAAFTIYAPTTAGTSGQVLTSTAGTPGWTNQSSLSAGYLKVHDIRNNNYAPNSTSWPLNNIRAWFNNTGTPDGTWWSGITTKGWDNTYNVWLLASTSHNSDYNIKGLFFRTGNGSTWDDWLSISTTRIFTVANNTSVADFVKGYKLLYAGQWFSRRDYAWALSATINVGSYGLDRMRYSAVCVRTGDLNGTYQQSAMLFVPTFSDRKFLYLAQMYTNGTAGSVTTSVKRYADYDTIIQGSSEHVTLIWIGYVYRESTAVTTWTAVKQGGPATFNLSISNSARSGTNSQSGANLGGNCPGYTILGGICNTRYFGQGNLSAGSSNWATSRDSGMGDYMVYADGTNIYVRQWKQIDKNNGSSSNDALGSTAQNNSSNNNYGYAFTRSFALYIFGYKNDNL